MSSSLPPAVRLAARTAGAASRLMRQGSGNAVAGRVLNAMAPDALERLSAQRRIVVVSGTNGKSTTTRFITEAWRTQGPVVTNADGGNLVNGLVRALDASTERHVVLEVDEQVLPEVVRRCSPELVVLLNLSRDQLDRVGEIARTAQRWRAALTQEGGHAPRVLVNADDPTLVAALEDVPRVTWVAAGSPWGEDARLCRRCSEPLVVGESWSCPGCGWARPEPWVTRTGSSLLGPDVRGELSLQLPDEGSLVNATMAVAAASLLGVEVSTGLQAMAEVVDVAGRYRRVCLDGRRIRLLLMKNPASAQNVLRVLGSTQDPVVIAFNAEAADGRDPSWLWDVSFRELQDRDVVVTGRRAADLSVRLTYAGVAHRRAPDVVAAVSMQPAGPVDLLANYTAFAAASRSLGSAPC